MLNKKLLEKQRVKNRFASYEVHIGHFSYNVTRLTNWETDKTDFLTPLRMRVRGN